MTHADCPAGLRVVGGTHERREVVNAPAAFEAHCSADPSARTDRECYLSAFRYGSDLDDHMKRHGGSTKGFAGPCWSPWLWFDIDNRDDPAAALDAARKLVRHLLRQYPGLDEDHVLIFFSGARGFHVGLPLPHAPSPAPAFNAACRRLAEGLAAAAG